MGKGVLSGSTVVAVLSNTRNPMHGMFVDAVMAW